MGIASEVAEAAAPEAESLLKPLASKAFNYAKGAAKTAASTFLPDAWSANVREGTKNLNFAARSVDHNLELHPVGKEIQSQLRDYEQESHRLFTTATRGIAPGNEKEIAAMKKTAANEARLTTFGSKDFTLAYALSSLKRNPETARLADVYAHDLAVYFHEEGVSKLATNSNKAIKALNLKNNEATPNLNLTSKYEHPKEGEQAINEYQHTIFVPFLALNHSGDNLKLLAHYSMTTVAKGLADSIKERGASETLLDSGVLAYKLERDFRENLAYKNGKLAKWTTPEIGFVLNKIIHNPGFSYVRDFNIGWAAHTAHHAAMEAATKFTEGTAKRDIGLIRAGERELRELNLNPEKILEQKGKLSQEDIKNAMYRGTDDIAFLNINRSRSALGQSNLAFRQMTKFHGFINKQAVFIKKEIVDSAKRGDWLHLAKVFAVFGIGGAVMGESIKTAKNLIYGKGFTLNQDLEDMSGANGVQASLDAWADTYANIAAYGLWHNLVRGAASQELARTIIGPAANMVLTGIQDTAKAGKGLYDLHEGKTTDGKQGDKLEHKGTQELKPLGRDALAYGIPVVGRTLSHVLLPNEKKVKKQHTTDNP